MFKIATVLFLATVRAQEQILFRDRFSSEEEPFPWTVFEEELLNHPCLLREVADVSRTTDVTKGGKGGALKVSSNAAGNDIGSNHVLAQRHLANEGLVGKFIYSTFFYVDTTILPETQTGPEMSIQSTRGVAFDDNGIPLRRTYIAGIQYVGNKSVPNKWNVWARDSDAGDVETAQWTPIPDVPPLDQDGWWKLKMVANFETNKYERLIIKDPTGTKRVINLKGFYISRENKFGDYAQGGFGITLESQNMFDCSNVRTFDAYYDTVLVRQRNGVVPIAPTFPDVPNNALVVGESASLTLPDADTTSWQVWIQVPPPKGQLTVDGSVLTYTATEEMSQVGIKYRACNSGTYLCGEGWWEVSARL